MILLGISGKRRTGKTLLATYLCEHFSWNHYSLAAPLKAEVRALYRLSVEHTDGAHKETVMEALGNKTPRQIMCEYGKRMRDQEPMYWVNRLAADMLKRPQAQFQWAVIADIRFKNEAEWIKRHGGYLVRLNRSEALTGPNIDDVSETDLDDYKGFDLEFSAEENATAADVPALAKRVMLHIVERQLAVA